MSEPTINLRLNATHGLLLPRRIPATAAILIGRDIEARADAIRAVTPEPLRSTLDLLLSDLQQSTDAIEAAAKPAEAPPTTRATPEALAALGTPEQLRSLPFVNNLEDREIGPLEAFLGLKQRVDGPSGAAAQRLFDAWFYDGRVFLSLPRLDQWVAVRQRFQNLTPAQQADVQTLGLTEEVARIQAINAWHGDLLHITQPQDASSAPPPSPSDTALARFRALTPRLIAFANLAWPLDDAASADHRRLLLGRYLDTVVSR